MNKRMLAAGLMLFSGLSHPSQLLIYGTQNPELVRPALAGTVFLLVGLFLLTQKRAALWLGLLLPLTFGIGASFRIVTQDPTVFTYLHTAIDFVVAALCAQLLFGGQTTPAQNRL